jgi:hypothetical protein
MKLGRINIQPNDDGSYQVECDVVKDSGQWSDKRISYSAKSIDDIVPKIKDAQTKISGMKEKPKKKGPNRSVEKYIGD